MTPATRTAPGAAWRALAEPLARWVMGRLVNRTDRCGRHYTDPGSGAVRRCADPPDEAKARDGFLDLGKLVRHFQAAGPADVLGGFAYGPDRRGKWALVDVDAHGPGDDPERNRRYALHLAGVCRDLGLSALLLDTNGRGSFHLWVLFDRPVPAAVLYAFGRWLVHDHAEHGFGEPPETFPKNAGDTPWGHWVRFPGRHHKRDVWPRVWKPAAGEWAEGDAAARFVLSLTGSDPALIPTLAAAHGAATVTGRDPAEPRAAPPPAAPNGKPGLTPWDDFNRRVGADAVAELLLRHGWQPDRARRADGAVGFVRPGKGPRDGEGGNLLEVDGVPIFYVFTDAAPPLRPNRGYTPAALVALLDHGGDFSAANRALRTRGYGGKRHPEPTAAPAAAPPAAPPSPPQSTAPAADPGDEKRPAMDVIIGWFREAYRPRFRRGQSVFSEALGREVKPTEGCFAPDQALLDALAACRDAPVNRAGVVDVWGLPKLFTLFARPAWKEMLGGLPDEPAAAEVVGSAEAEFRRAVAAALLDQVTLGRETEAGEQVSERRSLLDWGIAFAKPGRWQRVRSYLLWCRRGEDGFVRLALRVELFDQVRRAGLAALTHEAFAELARHYRVGTADECRPGGKTRCLVLDPDFVREVLEAPGQDDAMTDDASRVRTREETAS